MSSKKIIWSFIIACLPDLLSGLSGESITVNLKTGGNNKAVSLHKNSTYIINVIDIPINVAVIICQAHAQAENLTLSEQPVASIHNSISGKNIGFAIKLHNSESVKQIRLSNFNQEDVSVLIIITILDSFEPVPGGCNMEFPTEIAPYLRLKSDSLKTYLEYQHASFGSHRDEPLTRCGLSLPYLTYEIYVLFLEENDFGESEYFKKVELMSNVSSIKEHSSKAKSYSLHPDTRFSFLMYPNLGVVYNVIAKYTLNNEVKEAAYVPVVSYGCAPFDFSENGCQIIYSFKGKAFLLLLSFYGFIVAFFGHSFIGGSILFLGLLLSFLIGIILIGKYSNFKRESIIELSMVIGILGGLLFLFLWLRFQHPIILFLLNGLVFGFLFTATIFYTPLGNTEIFVNNKNFWSLLSLGILFVSILSIGIPFVMTVIGLSIVGCYVMLLFYDDFVGTRLSYIILNIIKRAVSKNHVFAANDLPFQTKDILMSTLWIVLSLIAVIIWFKKRQSAMIGISRSNSGYFTSSFTRSRSGLIFVQSENDVTHPPLLRESNNTAFYRTFPQ
ncbi:transmembrane 7 superfamily member 3 [Caerostris darwini]|uniref:Transmembrane 7 superfamily member 3 n=1 Tax=Caerostris darwini TaxID=1538125 RepID=A0AAV4UR43_9ARAC|nr:transmembrane 7 superfamily member 3 [Caerostris darwini]